MAVDEEAAHDRASGVGASGDNAPRSAALRDRALRDRALRDIVTMARAHGLTAQEIADALGDGRPGNPPRQGLLVRVLGFIGATFVFAGVCVFIALQWNAMNAPARVVITLGSGLAAFALAILASRDPRFDKAATPLFLIASALQPTGLMVLFAEYGSGGDWRWAGAITCGTMAAQLAATFTVLRRSTLLFACLIFGTLFAWTALDLLGMMGERTALVVGVSLVLAAMGIDRGPHRVITPAWYLVGSVAALYGTFDLVRDTPVEVLFLLAAAGTVYLSVALHVRTLLFVATLAILAYTGWFTGQHFADSVGWPLALVAFGLFLIAMSALAVRIDRRYVRPQA